MRTAVPEKIRKIIDDIHTKGNASLTRLTVLKKWFEQRPERLSAFGLWMARKAAGRKGKTKGEHGALLDEARKLLGNTSTAESFSQKIDPAAVEDLHDRARESQNNYKRLEWGPVRVIESWPLLLVEKGLALHAGLDTYSGDGYKLAADWAQNYDPRYGNGLNGPSAGKLEELVRWMFNVEALEEGE